MAAASAAQLLDILRGVLTSAEEECTHADARVLLKWIDEPGSADVVAGALASDGHVRELEAFLVGSPDMMSCFAGMLSALAADALPAPFPRGAAENAVRELQRRWNEADLSTDDEVGITVDALNKAKTQQMPMVLLVMQTLRMFPPGMSEKLDKQAAAVGETVRKRNASAGGTANPAELVASMMQSPVFAQMMQEVMQPPEHEDSETDMHQRKMESARLSVIEMRLTALEKREGKGGPPHQTVRNRNRKRQGSRASY